VPDRMEWEVLGQTDTGRPIHGVVVNALETADQIRDFARWQEIRAIMKTDPAGAKDLLATYGADVKLPVFVENNIHGNEEEGADAMMQVLRDLVTLPRGTNAVVDDFLDHAILIMIPTINPDGRAAGTRANSNGFDMNRDLLVQSQPEIRLDVALQQEWLAPVGLATHGYVSPTLMDGLTKPHNPGIDYDIFVGWNQRRLDENEADYAAIGMGITRPVNDYTAAGVAGPGGGPAVAEGWDDWGPFYTQTYMAFYGVDSSTLEMCSSGAGCNGRFGSKRAAYVGFWSSVDYWIANRQAILDDQLEIFERGVNGAARPSCCADPEIAGRGFAEDQHNWMVPYPEAFIIPTPDGPQRSDAEANRMVQWLLDNGIEVERMTASHAWDGTTYPEGSYVVWMDQAFRGLALTTLHAGQDISLRIIQLYAPPGAWSHGLLWGADVVEVPPGAATFTPTTAPIASTSELQGGVRPGPADWYAVTPGGVRDHQAIWDLLRGGVYGEIAEESFESTSGGTMPAGSLLFPADPDTAATLTAAGDAAGLWFETVEDAARPATSNLAEPPQIALLAGNTNRNDTITSLMTIFGDDAQIVTTASLLGGEDPLLDRDVIVNTGQVWPANTTAQDRLNAFFARGGGYVGTGQSTNNHTFLSSATPPLVVGSLTQASVVANGGILRWNNVGGAADPLTGPYPAQDYLFMPSSVTYFSAVPTGAQISGRYPNDANQIFVAGHWAVRSPATLNAPVIVRGNTEPRPGASVGRYTATAFHPFSRHDAEREWPLIQQSALWTNLTDETKLDQAITFDPIPDQQLGDPPVTVHPTASSGRTVSLSASGPCTLSSPSAPSEVTSTAVGTCTVTAFHPGDANYNPAPDASRSFAILPGPLAGEARCPGAETLPGTHVIGTPGPDELVGVKGPSVICGGAGDDILIGGPGDDILIGGPGDDILRGAPGDDILRGGSGDDVLRGMGGDDVAGGGAGDDRIKGGPAADRLRGGFGADRIAGGRGDDLLRGGPGFDVLNGGAGEDTCVAGGGGARMRTCERRLR